MREVIMSYTLDETGKMIDMQRVGELVRCEDCARKPFCLSEVATVDKHKVQVSHEGVKYCSLGERREDGT